MALRFVKTSVLTSEDGIDFSTETVVESEEQRSIRLNAENAAQRPLYMQLQEQQDKKQAEYDAITKQIFAPPKGLDEEEFGFISALEEVKYRKEKLRQTEEAKAMEEFRYALRANQRYNHTINVFHFYYLSYFIVKTIIIKQSVLWLLWLLNLQRMLPFCLKSNVSIPKFPSITSSYMAV